MDFITFLIHQPDTAVLSFSRSVTQTDNHQASPTVLFKTLGYHIWWLFGLYLRLHLAMTCHHGSHLSITFQHPKLLILMWERGTAGKSSTPKVDYWGTTALVNWVCKERWIGDGRDKQLMISSVACGKTHVAWSGCVCARELVNVKGGQLADIWFRSVLTEEHVTLKGHIFALISVELLFALCLL